jgi:hypothetical protein
MGDEREMQRAAEVLRLPPEDVAPRLIRDVGSENDSSIE